MGSNTAFASATSKMVIGNCRRIILDGSKVLHYRWYSEDKSLVRDFTINQINNLINKVYDNYRYKASRDSPHVYSCAFDKSCSPPKLAAMIMLLRKKNGDVEFNEIGVSIVDPDYQKLGLQTYTWKGLEQFIYQIYGGNFYPLYATLRLLSAHSQVQIKRNRLADETGKFISVGKCAGFAPIYVFNRNERGDFYLEFHMFMEPNTALSHPSIREIYLPPIAYEKKFRIFSSEINPFIKPVFSAPYNFWDESNLCYPIYDYEQELWYKWLPYIQVILHEGNKNFYKNNEGFVYSDDESPNSNVLIIHIEHIQRFDFYRFFTDSMKSINITIQISDFDCDASRIANIILMDILIRQGFVPVICYIALKNKKQVQVAMFSRWQGIEVESKFEVLESNREGFETFLHDCHVQNIDWLKIVNYIDDNKLLDLNLHVEKNNVILLNEFLPNCPISTPLVPFIPNRIIFPLDHLPLVNLPPDLLDNFRDDLYFEINQDFILTQKTCEKIAEILKLVQEQSSEYNLTKPEIKGIVINLLGNPIILNKSNGNEA